MAFRNGGIHLVAQVSTFAAGFALVYHYMCPDDDTLYDVHPVWKQRDYAYVTLHQVKKEDQKLFEEAYKGVIRASQQQPGYLSSKLYRARDFENSKYQYFGMSTYVDPGSQYQVSSKARYMSRWDMLPGEHFKSPYVFKTVVNDSEYVPLNTDNALQVAV